MAWSSRKSRPQRKRGSPVGESLAEDEGSRSSFGIEGSQPKSLDGGASQPNAGQKSNEKPPIEDLELKEVQRLRLDGRNEATYMATEGDAQEAIENDRASEDLDHDRAVLRKSAEQGSSYEYLDHTADVQLHAWGNSLEQAFVNTGLAMLNYMTPLKDGPSHCEEYRQFHAEGHDMHSLLFGFLDELLFLFHSDLTILKELKIDKLDRSTWTIEASGSGYTFDRQKHGCGTEVKAITYSAMQVNEQTSQNDTEIFVVVDI